MEFSRPIARIGGCLLAAGFSLVTLSVGFAQEETQQEQKSPGQLADELADLIFGTYEQVDAAAAGEEEETPAQDCTEDSVEICVERFDAAMSRLEQPDNPGGYMTTLTGMQAIVNGEAACDLGHGQTCGRLGLYYAAPPEPDRQPDFDNARSAFVRGCDLDDGMSCAALLEAALDGSMTVSDEERTGIAWRGCQADNAFSCHVLGYHMSQGAGTTQDYATALAAYVKACDMGIAEACGNLGIMYENGMFVPEIAQRAIEYYEWACQMGDEGFCGELARLRP